MNMVDAADLDFSSVDLSQESENDKDGEKGETPVNEDYDDEDDDDY